MNKTLRRTLSAIALSALLAGLTLTPVMAAQRDSSPTAASTSICTQQITGSAAAPASARQLQQHVVQRGGDLAGAAGVVEP